MYTSTLFVVSTLVASSFAGYIPISARQSTPCFLIGSTTIPQETADSANALANSVTCDTSKTTIANVPDVSSNGLTFSSVSFATSSSTPLEFALSTFATADPLASTDLALFQDRLDVYIATEAGIRSVAGPLTIKVPKFFLAFQVSRIKTAQGIAIPEAGQQVDHLLGKVLNNAAKEDKALLDQVRALATELN